MVKTIREIQAVIGLPLQIDSDRAEVIAAAARIYNGKPLLNSISGKKEEMKTLFPLLKKYGGAAICLTLNEKAFPPRRKGGWPSPTA